MTAHDVRAVDDVGRRRPSWPLQFACALAALVAVGLCLFHAWVSGLDRDRLTTEAVEAIQVLAGPSELWVFVEIDRLVWHRHRLASPPFMTVDRRQVVAVVTSAADARLLTVPPGGPSFNRNLAKLLVHGGQVHLFSGPSLGHRASAFAWREPAFQRLPLAENRALLGELELAEVHPADVDPTVARINEAAGWRLLLAENAPLRFDEERGELLPIPDDELTWAGRTFTWSLEHRDGLETVGLRAHVEGTTRWLPIITFDPRRHVMTDPKFETRSWTR